MSKADNYETSKIKESKEELLDCIHNLMGCFDTPIGRRLIKDPISDEARKIARKICCISCTHIFDYICT